MASVVLPAFDAPEWMLRALIIAIAAGFIPALVLAWRYEITTSGVVEEEAAEAAGQDSLIRGRRFDIVIIGVLVLALALLIAERLTLDDRAPDLPVTGIGVLPFDSLSINDEDAFIAGGLHEEVLTRLSHLADLRVISRTSMMRIAETPLTIPEIGDRLNVSHVLEGSVRRDGDNVRVTVQLIDATNDSHLWAENFDRTFADLFRVQADIALAIAAQLRIELSPDSVAQISDLEEVDPRAYELLLRAIDEIRSDRFGGNKEVVVGLLDRALSMDPDFLAAKVLLADQLGRLSMDGEDPDGRRRDRAIRLVSEVRNVRPDHILARRALGHYYYTLEHDYERALEEYQSVITVIPNDIVAVVNLRNAYKRTNNRQEFLYWARRAVELSPESQPVVHELMLALLANRQFEEAVAFTEANITRFPAVENWKFELVDLYLGLWGDGDAYLEAGERLRAEGEWSALDSDLSWLYFERDGLAAAEEHIEARREGEYGFGAALADTDHAMMLRIEGRDEEGDDYANRALAYVKAEFPVDSDSATQNPFFALLLAQVPAIAGNKELAQAYRNLVDTDELTWDWMRGKLEVGIGEVEALLGDPDSGWARVQPYADDPYIWVARDYFKAAPRMHHIFGEAAAFQAFLEE